MHQKERHQGVCKLFSFGLESCDGTRPHLAALLLGSSTCHCLVLSSFLLLDTGIPTSHQSCLRNQSASSYISQRYFYLSYEICHKKTETMPLKNATPTLDLLPTLPAKKSNKCKSTIRLCLQPKRRMYPHSSTTLSGHFAGAPFRRSQSLRARPASLIRILQPQPRLCRHLYRLMLLPSPHHRLRLMWPRARVAVNPSRILDLQVASVGNSSFPIVSLQA